MTCILCIDDNQDVLEPLGEMLRASGFKTLAALSGKQGIRLLLQNSVDLVVLDYEMPEMNGGLVAQAIRRCKPKIPIILFTGMLDDIPYRVRHNVDGLVHKTDFDGLLTSINTLTNVSLGTRKAT